MSIPDYQSVMLPLLKSISDGQEHSFRERIDFLSEELKLSDDERKELLPSGKPKFDDRVGWAKTYMGKAGLLESTKRGFFMISQKGLDLLKENPPKIDLMVLEKYPDFIEFRALSKKIKEISKESDVSVQHTPEELIESGYKIIKEQLAKELLEKIKSCSPSFFERLVVELLIKMGYGGSRKNAGKAIGKTGDGGIDGIIHEDRLGLDTIYIQAKRWSDSTISSSEIHKFVGALAGKKAKKGIFITTSKFSNSAIEYASSLENRVILIDGDQLSEYMIDFNVGVSSSAIYEIKKIDLDFFSD